RRAAPSPARRLPRPPARVGGRLGDGALAVRALLRSARRGRLHADWSRTPLDLPHPRWPHPGMLEGVRDKAVLEWRFAHSPLTVFRFLYLRHRTGAPPAAWFVCHRDGDVLRIADFGFEAGAAVSHCVARLAQLALAEGCSSLALECCLPEQER